MSPINFLRYLFFALLACLTLAPAPIALADTFSYSDDFETDKAMIDSYSHSSFTLSRPPYVHFHGLLYYENSGGVYPPDNNRALGFYNGWEVYGRAFLAYQTIPPYAAATGGFIEFDARRPLYSTEVFIYGSTTGSGGWTLLGAFSISSSYYSWEHIYLPVQPQDPVQYIRFEGNFDLIMDNLNIEITYDYSSLAADKTSLDFGCSTASDSFQVANDGHLTMNYHVSVVEGSNIFNISPAGGTSTGPADKNTHLCTCDRRAISPGQTVAGKIKISSPQADDSPKYITLSAARYSGDLNADGKVDHLDLSLLCKYWLRDEPSVDIYPPGSGDGIVNLFDYYLLTEGWLAGTKQS